MMENPPTFRKQEPTPSSRIQELERRVKDNALWVDRLRNELGHVVVGQRALIDRLLVAVLTGGHVLVEGLPGLAKTLSLKTLSAAVHGEFARIQFTPDMLPADIVGTLVFDPRTSGFHTKKGPVFTNFLLADEINRAPAKVQSALLEAMQEHQVTIGDETHALPRPFLVMATQNPIEQEGTYELPEAQLDRFLLKVVVTYPTKSEERQILDSMAKTTPRFDVGQVVSLDQILASREVIDLVHVDDRVKDYIVDVVAATRRPSDIGLDLDAFVRYGGSPRATIALTLSAKAWAFLHGRGYVTPQDIKAIAMDVLRHRVGVTYEAEARDVSSEQIVTADPRHRPGPVRRAMKQPVDDALSEVLSDVRAIELSTRRKVEEVLSGQYRSVFRGRGIDFDQAREYVPGDDIRSIDWNVTARTGRPFVKEHVEERTLTLMLVVDVSASNELGTADRDKRELAARLASALAFSAIRSSDRVGLLLVSDRVERYVPPGKGRRHVLRIIREILAAEPEGRGTDLELGLDFVNRAMKRRGIVFLVSDFLTNGDRARDMEELEHAMTLTRMKHDLVAVRVHDPREGELPNVGLVALEDAETGEMVEIDTGSKKVREQYRIETAKYLGALTDALRRAQVDVVGVGTDEDPTLALYTFFRRRARRLS